MYNNEELQRIHNELGSLVGNMVYEELLQQELPDDNPEIVMENPSEEEYYDEDYYFNWKGLDDNDNYFDEDSEYDEDFEENDATTPRRRPRYVTPERMYDAFNISMSVFWQQVFDALLKHEIMPTQLVPPELLRSNNFTVYNTYEQWQSDLPNSSSIPNADVSAATSSQGFLISEEDKKTDEDDNKKESKKSTTLPFKYSCVARDYYRKFL